MVGLCYLYFSFSFSCRGSAIDKIKTGERESNRLHRPRGIPDWRRPISPQGLAFGVTHLRGLRLAGILPAVIRASIPYIIIIKGAPSSPVRTTTSLSPLLGAPFGIYPPAPGGPRQCPPAKMLASSAATFLESRICVRWGVRSLGSRGNPRSSV